jgi:hypothetical protein
MGDAFLFASSRLCVNRCCPKEKGRPAHVQAALFFIPAPRWAQEQKIT